MSNNIVALVPVRGGSKSIPYKNIKEFCGHPLVYWVLNALCNSFQIEKVFISTEDNIISDVVSSFGFKKVEIFRRSNETAHDESSTEEALLEFLKVHNEFSHIVLAQATSPLLETHDIDKGLEKYFNGEFDSLLSVVRQKRFIWDDFSNGAAPVNYDFLTRPRRQDWDGYFIENGAFYISSKSAILNSKSRISGKIGLYEMNPNTYFEIDDPDDWFIIEALKNLTLFKDKFFLNKEINLLICDVDGVLTDGGMYYGDNGIEQKKFNTRDGMGISLIQNKGIKVMFLTSENNDIIKNRAKKLNIDFVFMGAKNKLNVLNDFFSLNPDFCFSKSIYIGDDINDLECISLAYYSCSPADAHPIIRSKVNYVSKFKGGDGCVREICDNILKNIL